MAKKNNHGLNILQVWKYCYQIYYCVYMLITYE